MTLNDFIDIWTRKKHIVYICPDKYYDDMFDLIDEVDEGKKKIEDYNEYTICALIPHCCEFVTAWYLKDKYAYATVEHFYVGNGYIIVWIEEVEHE